YARVGGLSVKELGMLELEFLWRMEWKIVPKAEVLEDYFQSLVSRCPEYEIEQDGAKGTNSDHRMEVEPTAGGDDSDENDALDDDDLMPSPNDSVPTTLALEMANTAAG